MNNPPDHQETEEEKKARIAARKIKTPKRRLPQVQSASPPPAMSPPSTSPIFPPVQSPTTASAPSATAPTGGFFFSTPASSSVAQQPSSATAYSIVSSTPVQAAPTPAFPSASESTTLKRKSSDQITREGSNKLFHGSSPLSQSWSASDTASKSSDSGLFGATSSAPKSTFTFSASTAPAPLQRQDSQQAQGPAQTNFTFPSNPNPQSEKPPQPSTTTPSSTGFGATSSASTSKEATTTTTTTTSTSSTPAATTSATPAKTTTTRHVHFDLSGEEKQDKAKESTAVTSTTSEKDKGKEKSTAANTRIAVPPLTVSEEKASTSSATSSIFGPPRSTESEQTVLQTTIKQPQDITGRTRVNELPPEAINELVSLYNLIKAQTDLADDMANGSLSYHGEQIQRIGQVVDRNLKEVPIMQASHKAASAQIDEIARDLSDQRQYTAAVGKFCDLRKRKADTGPVPDFDHVYAHLVNNMHKRCLTYKSAVDVIEERVRKFSSDVPTPNDVARMLDRLVIASKKMAVRVDQIHREVEKIKSLKGKKVAG